ncbi:MAG TPA: PAS domain S-box protein, partial [Puia sp.]|nr:PAS domain S-box protein [Puia sp.]
MPDEPLYAGQYFSRNEEQQYHLMIGEVEDYAILMLDSDGIIRNWNKGAEKIKGYTEAEAVGMNFRMFYRPEDREAGLPEQLIATAVREGKAVHEGWRLR